MKILKFFTIGFVLISFFLTSCKELDLEIDVPKCVEKEIRKMKKDKHEEIESVWEWRVDGQVYYYFITSSCCDHFNFLYDNNCNKVCAPDGGISGLGDGNCPEFEGEIEKILVWKER